MKTAPLVLAGFMVLAVIWAAAGQTAQETNKTPANEAMKVAGIAGVYIGMMENCTADTTAIRNHYWNRIAKLSRTDDGQAHAIFEGTIQRSKKEAAAYKAAPADACQKTLPPIGPSSRRSSTG